MSIYWVAGIRIGATTLAWTRCFETGGRASIKLVRAWKSLKALARRAIDLKVGCECRQGEFGRGRTLWKLVEQRFGRGYSRFGDRKSVV